MVLLYYLLLDLNAYASTNLVYQLLTVYWISIDKKSEVADGFLFDGFFQLEMNNIFGQNDEHSVFFSTFDYASNNLFAQKLFP